MKVNSDITFKGLYNNKTLAKGFEFAAKDPALFGAAATVGFAFIARPAAIMSAPNTEKENRIIACTKSYISSSLQLLLTLFLSTPFAKSVEKISDNPSKYLKPDTIKTLKGNCKHLAGSKSYEFATQLMKLGTGLAIALPKAMITAACIPFVLDKIFHKPKSNQKQDVNFKGKEKIAKTVGKVLDKKGVQDFSNKYKDTNFVMHVISLSDTITTATFVQQLYKNKDIEEKGKNTLAYNAVFSTGLSIASSYILDNLTQKPTQKFIENYRKANKNSPNLEQQIKGIRIVKPLMLVGCVYYMLIPFVSTIFAELAGKRNGCNTKNL